MWKVLDLLIFIFTLERPGYDVPRAPQKDPQERPKGYRDTALAVSIDEFK